MLPAPLLLVLATGPVTPSLDAVAAPLPVVEDPNDPWKRLKVSADGRLRAEGTFDQTNGEDRIRGRMRFRLSGDYQIADGLKAGARLSTLSDGRDANNPHWDFGDADGFSGAEVGIDRMFLEWQPESDWKLTGGKFAHVFTRPSPLRELAWDDDVQPAGAAAVWSPKSDGSVSFDLRALYAVATEINQTAGSGADPAVFGAQANLYVKASESTTLTLATSYSDWSSLGNFTIDQGNTADAGGFAIWDTYAGITLAGEGLRQITGFGQYFNNLDDDSGEDTGFAVGIQVGQTKGKGNWNAMGAYYDLEANSVFSSVAQDDTPIAGTGLGDGMKGFVVGVQYFVLENVSLRLWALTSDADASDDPYRIRFDIDFRIP
ncbi:MAG: putative porin [Planctomycetes bacterium]|nr:putative porin [Planctomycetota bacterium]